MLRQDYKLLIDEIVLILRNNKKIDEFTRYTMCENMYSLLLKYFDSPIDEKSRQSTELDACKYAITTLIPTLENRVYACEKELMPKYYDLWQKAYAFAARRSLEHFIDYLEMDMPPETRVFGNRRNVLRPLVFFLNKSAFDPKLKYIEASYPPRIW